MDTQEDNQVLCPSCGDLCPEDAQFCQNCRSPITSYASTGPFESIFAEGAAYRSAINSPTKPIVLIGVWLIFFPLALCGVMVIWDSLAQEREFDPSDTYLLILGSVFALLGGYVLWATTRNFLKGKKRS